MNERELVLKEEIDNLIITAYKNDAEANEVIIVLDGAIDTYNSQLFEKFLNDLIKSGYIYFSFLCAKLNYISSMGIGMFINLLANLTKKTGKITFLDVQEKVYNVFNNLGFVKFFNFK